MRLVALLCALARLGLGPCGADVVDLQRRAGQLTSAKGRELQHRRWRLHGAVPARTKTEIGLYRIIGNPLPPRHDASQLWDNLQYILKNEPPLPRARKIFVFNRLSNESLAARARQAVEEHGHSVLEIPLNMTEYVPFQAEDTYGLLPSEWGTLISPKFSRLNANLYLMNNNGARNFALRHGRMSGWAWTLPFDGNCLFDSANWASFVSELERAEVGEQRYVAIPLVRSAVSAESVAGEPPKLVMSGEPGEHQVAFSPRATLRFDPTVPYGYRPKVHLLWQLRVKGKWDGWSSAAVFSAEGRCKPKEHYPPNVCLRTLPRVLDDEARLTATSSHVVYRLPDLGSSQQTAAGGGGRQPAGGAAARGGGHGRGRGRGLAPSERGGAHGSARAAKPHHAAPLTTGESSAALIDRGQLRERGVSLKVAEMDARAPPSTRDARHFVKPLFYNVWSMEAMRRECLVAEPADVARSRSRPSLAPGVSQHHCVQLDALVSLARRNLPKPPISVMEKLRSPHYQRPDGASVRHYTNLPLYDWRVDELPERLTPAELRQLASAGFTEVGKAAWRRANQRTFVRWDGRVRPSGEMWAPGSDGFDRTRSYELHSNVTLFALAHFYTGERAFARKAVQLARVWWLDARRSLLPTLEFAQFSRPRAERASGVIEMKDLTWTLDAIALLKRSTVWTEDDSRKMGAWCRAYARWLDASNERHALNNHGWYYAVQRAAVGHCAGERAVAIGARLIAHVLKFTRSSEYIRADGVMPLEAKRDRGLHYHFFTAYALMLASRALTNLGDERHGRMLSLALGSTLRMLGGPRRNQLKDADNMTEAMIAERWAPLCQWVRDYRMVNPGAVSEHAKSCRLRRFATAGAEGGAYGTKNVPPLLATDVHSGLVPFMNLMW